MARDSRSDGRRIPVPSVFAYSDKLSKLLSDFPLSDRPFMHPAFIPVRRSELLTVNFCRVSLERPIEYLACLLLCLDVFLTEAK
jgi:hypothetical protein